MELTDKKISFVVMCLRFLYKYVVCFLLAFVLLGAARSQQQHFIYFQHEQSLSFYVKYERQIFRSSPTGYLILSKLARGRQQIYLGLGDANQQLLRFDWDSLGSDKGYLIKSFPDTGWGLFDLQTSVLKFPGSKAEASGKTTDKALQDSAKNDPFGNLLAQVTQDSTVKYATTVNAIKKADEYRSVMKSTVIELGKQDFGDVREIRFLVREINRSDTVSVLMRNNATTSDTSANKMDAGQKKEENLNSEKKDTLINSPSVNNVLPDMSSDTLLVIPADTIIFGKDSVMLAASDSIVIYRDASVVSSEKLSPNNCTLTADEDQFVKLRMRMAGQYTEEKMIEEALTVFKQVCFTTTQLRRLSLLLLKDEMKYKFFATALGYISDAYQFPALRNELQEEINRLRFDALIANQ
jgi:hypothetical protein